MATSLTVTAKHDGTVDNADIRDALRGLDVSVTSPVRSTRDFSTAHDGDTITVKAGGDEDFTKKSTQAIIGALEAVEGVESVEHEGGYEPADEE